MYRTLTVPSVMTRHLHALDRASGSAVGIFLGRVLTKRRRAQYARPPCADRRAEHGVEAQPPGLPAIPQCFGDTPSMITWMCSTAAPLDSWSAVVSASIIFGTDSSVTRCSYSLTSITGISFSSYRLASGCRA